MHVNQTLRGAGAKRTAAESRWQSGAREQFDAAVGSDINVRTVENEGSTLKAVQFVCCSQKSHPALILSAAEAWSMDPQQRQLLERAYATLHADGMLRTACLTVPA